MNQRAILVVVALAAAAGLVWALASLSGGDRSGLDDAPRGPSPEAPAEPDRPAPPPYVPAEEGEVSGRVLAEGGSPVGGARVEFHLAPDVSSREVEFSGSGLTVRGSMGIDRIARREPIGVVEAGVDGAFRFRTPEPGPYLVTASAEGHARASREGVERGTTGLVLRLAAAGRVTGRVVDEEGEPVVAAVIGAPGVPEVLTKADGSFRLDAIRAGTETKIRASAKGYESAQVVVTLEAGESREIEDPFVLSAKAGITGRVFGADGKPLAAAMVLPGGAMNLFAVESGGAGGGTDLGGRWHVEPGSAGDFEFTIRHPEHLAGATDKVHHEPGRRTLVPDVRLRAGGIIAGRIVDEAGRPVRGAAPRAEKEGREMDLTGLVLLSLSEATTPVSDARGEYRIAGLEPGTYTLRVEADGYRTSLTRDIVISGEETATVDVALDRGASISGRVVDGEGAPVEGVRVIATVPAEDGEGTGSPFVPSDRSVDGRTDEKGRFTIRGLGTKPVFLQAVLEGWSGATRDQVAPGTTDLELVLARNGSVSGIVLDDGTGEPVANAIVSVTSADEMEFRQASSDENGSFSIPDVPPGTYRIAAENEVHAPLEGPEVQLREAEEVTGIALRMKEGLVAAGFVVRASDSRPVAEAHVSFSGPVDRSVMTEEDGTFRVRGLVPGTYEATVTAEGFATATKDGISIPTGAQVRIEMSLGGTIRGIVRDADGRPSAGRMVVLGDGSGQFGEGQVMTDEGGEFVFENVAPGERSILLLNTSGGGIDMKTKRVTVEEGQEAWVEFGGTPEKGNVRLTGRLMDRGKPLGGRMLVLFPLESEGVGVLGAMQMVTTDSEGRFDVGDLSPGRYAVLAGTAGGDMGASTTLTVSGTGEVRQDIDLPAGTFGGVVTRGDTGEPVEGARILLTSETALSRPIRTTGELFSIFGGQARTDAEGRFRVGNASPGRSLVVVTAPGLAVAVVRDVVVTEAKAPPPAAIRLEPGSEVTVRVRRPGGGVVAGAEVSLFAADGTWIPLGEDLSRKTAAHGELDLRLPSGDWTLQVQASGLAPQRKEIRVAGDREVVFGLTAGGTARLLATAGGEPVEGAAVRVYRADGTELWRVLTEESMMTGGGATRTGVDGRLTLPNLPPGNYRVVATTDDGRTGEAEVRIREGEITEATLDLK